eukprot:gene3855-2733_t
MNALSNALVRFGTTVDCKRLYVFSSSSQHETPLSFTSCASKMLQITPIKVLYESLFAFQFISFFFVSFFLVGHMYIDFFLFFFFLSFKYKYPPSSSGTSCPLHLKVAVCPIRVQITADGARGEECGKIRHLNPLLCEAGTAGVYSVCERERCRRKFFFFCSFLLDEDSYPGSLLRCVSPAYMGMQNLSVGKTPIRPWRETT